MYLLRKRVLLTWLGALTFAGGARAQLFHPNLPDHDSNPYYFGITLSYNSARFKTFTSPKMLQSDSVLSAKPRSSGGFGLGLLATLRVVPNLELRFNPQLIFADRDLVYQISHPVYPEDSSDIKQVQSSLLTFPLHLKFESDRIGNFRVYVFAGPWFNYDLASNSANRRAEDMVKIKASDFGLDFGAGLHFYFPSFIFSPEIRFSNGFTNVLTPDPGNIFSSCFDGLKTRMVEFTIHLEG